MPIELYPDVVSRKARAIEAQAPERCMAFITSYSKGEQCKRSGLFECDGKFYCRTHLRRFEDSPRVVGWKRQRKNSKPIARLPKRTGWLRIGVDSHDPFVSVYDDSIIRGYIRR